MLSATSLKRFLLVVSLMGITAALIFVYYLAVNIRVPRTDRPASQNLVAGGLATANYNIPPPALARSGLPIRLKIPKINTDAAIDRVGLTPQGAMDVPTSPTTVAWLEIGPRPGENGNAVMAGHFGWKDGRPAVFDNLHTLRVGDNIFVEDENGTAIVFVVRELRTYKLSENTSHVFNSSDGKAHLNLITCQGVWNKTKNSYSSRLVVFADKK